MASYVYDEFRLTLTPRADGDYDAVGLGPDQVAHRSTLRLPFDHGELERRVVGVAQQTTRSATRDIGGAGGPGVDAEELGGALATALLTGEIAGAYDEARRQAAEDGRGLRLTLSLGSAPALLSVPWELLYRPPTFLANQRQTPVVRHLDVPGLPAPPAIDGAVRMLGVIANPTDTAPLDVDAERARVERAVAGVAGRGLVELDWLEPATPRRLREVLRDGSYHVLHYVGHGDFTADGEGVLYLESTTGDGHTELDRNELASLLADQTSLRLVVLNACDGARTTLIDPFAGVATTLVQLGVPAVVGMQFAISDAAAILFAEELYTNLIGRGSPIDAAVSEARKAIFVEQGTVEWATPVLFMGDTDVPLWRRSAPPSELPRPRPPSPPRTTTQAGRGANDHRTAPKPMRWIAAAILVAALAAGAIWAATRGDGDPSDAAAASTTPVDSVASAGTTAGSGTSRAAAAAPPFAAQTLAGTIDSVDEEDRHPLDVVAGQLLYIGGSGACGPQLQYRLLAPDGSQVGATPDVCVDIGRVEVDRTGPWTLVVDSWGGTGPYSVVLTPIRADTVAPLEDGLLATGEIVDRGEIHRYRFAGDAGERIYVQAEPAPSGCLGVAHQLFTAAGQEVSGEPYACQDIDVQILPSTGEYELRVSSYGGGLGTYGVTLVRVPPVEVRDVAIGDTVSGEITVAGQRVDYRFAADAGTVLHVVGSGPATTGVAYELMDPGGSPYGGEPWASGSSDPTVPASGTQTLAVSSYAGGIGAYEITITAG